MYHYVRDLPRTPFPRIKGLLVDEFCRQIDLLRERFEMATLESSLAFLAGQYRPRRDLCLLTFDDGLKEHFEVVFPLLAERRVQGVFFLITRCLEEQRVVSVHKNHFLMAALDFAAYRAALLERLATMSPAIDTQVDPALAARNYRWDTPEVAALKYLVNFRLGEPLRDEVLGAMFADHLGDERQFARQLYVNWDEARQMQDAGMAIGGHSHCHAALAKLDADQQRTDVETCADLLGDRLGWRAERPFSYPYGKPGDAFNEATVRAVADCGFACAFSTVVGKNVAGQDAFQILRIDTKDATPQNLPIRPKLSCPAI